MKSFLVVLLLVVLSGCGALPPLEQRLSAGCPALQQYYAFRDVGLTQAAPDLDGRLEQALVPCEVFKALVWQHEHPGQPIPDILPDSLGELMGKPLRPQELLEFGGGMAMLDRLYRAGNRADFFGIGIPSS